MATETDSSLHPILLTTFLPSEPIAKLGINEENTINNVRIFFFIIYALFSQILLIADMLEPVDTFVANCFLDGDMRHDRVG